VRQDAWYYWDVVRVYENGLMVGTGADEFSPTVPVTRGMLVTVLHRLAGEPAAAAGGSFSDVLESAWYARAIAWAKESGIVNGVGGNLFAPGDSVTREQAAVILLNYANHMDLTMRNAQISQLDFADAAQISDWALEGAAYCYSNGIIGGKPNKLFDPQCQATRAEIAAILNRFVETADSGAEKSAQQQ
jgi:hypothetical protein